VRFNRYHTGSTEKKYKSGCSGFVLDMVTILRAWLMRLPAVICKQTKYERCNGSSFSQENCTIVCSSDLIVLVWTSHSPMKSDTGKRKWKHSSKQRLWTGCLNQEEDTVKSLKVVQKEEVSLDSFRSQLSKTNPLVSVHYFRIFHFSWSSQLFQNSSSKLIIVSGINGRHSAMEFLV